MPGIAAADGIVMPGIGSCAVVVGGNATITATDSVAMRTKNRVQDTRAPLDEEPVRAAMTHRESALESARDTSRAVVMVTPGSYAFGGGGSGARMSAFGARSEAGRRALDVVAGSTRSVAFAAMRMTAQLVIAAQQADGVGCSLAGRGESAGEA
jgi:hypothetical protein